MYTLGRHSTVTLILAVLLISTTPIGTGGGVHEFQLVHPLFTHLHMYNGRMLTHEQLQDAIANSRIAAKTVLGAGVAAGSALPTGESGLVVSPTVPLQAIDLFLRAETRSSDAEPGVQRQFEEAPPDPPPTSTFA